MKTPAAILPQPGWPEVRALLQACGLPHADLDEQSMAGFLSIRDQDRLVATLGLEIHDRHALLRSLAVDTGFRRQGLAEQLLKAVEARALAAGVNCIWLLTETARDWFAARGYRVSARAEAPGCIRNSAEFMDLCPDSAILMHRCLRPD